MLNTKTSTKIHEKKVEDINCRSKLREEKDMHNIVCSKQWQTTYRDIWRQIVRHLIHDFVHPRNYMIPSSISPTVDKTLKPERPSELSSYCNGTIKC